MILDDVLADLAAESDRLRASLLPLDDAGWHAPTPAVGWDVATQIAHLTWTDEAAVLAARAARGDTEDWDAVVACALGDPEGFVDTAAAEMAQAPGLAAAAGTDATGRLLLARWDTARTALAEALRGAEGKLPWFGPPMSPVSMATARFMETWAHALDVYEALAHRGIGAVPEPTDRIRHICHLGIRTRDWAFRTRGLEPPVEEFRVELTAPGGATWSWGPQDATQRVSGPAYDFARVVTQRIHRADTSLAAVGVDADRWLDIAQAFAGPPGAGREARG